MDPQAFIRLSIGLLGLRYPEKPGIHVLSSPCTCEIRLRGFPAQIASISLLSSPEATIDRYTYAGPADLMVPVRFGTGTRYQMKFMVTYNPQKAMNLFF
ncbi:hypothetical protein Hanom_Chr15g01340991 [Helianthus anomalus]